MSAPRGSTDKRLSGLALLLALLASAGLLVAALATPLVLGTGLATKSVAEHFDRRGGAAGAGTCRDSRRLDQVDGQWA